MEETNKKPKGFERFLRKVEILGNKIPDPMLMFIVLALAVVVISGICSALGVSAVNPATGEVVEVVNLCSIDGMLKMLTKAVTNFIGMSALGLTLTCMLGVGLCESSGLFNVALKGLATNSKGSDLKVIAVFVFVCVMADCTGGAGFVVMPPVGALLWAAMGRHGPQPHGRYAGRLRLGFRRVCFQPAGHLHGRGEHELHRGRRPAG